MQYAEIPGNSRREFYDSKFPGIPEREFPVALPPCMWRPRRNWNWVSAHGVKTRNIWATGPRKKFDDIFSRLNTIHERDLWMADSG